MTKTLIVVDTNRYDFSMGICLFFIENVKIFLQKNKVNEIDLVIVSDNQNLINNFINNLILPLFKTYLKIKKIKVLFNKNELETFLKSPGYQYIFPDSDSFKDKNSFDSTIPFQKHFNQFNSLPLLTPNEDLKSWAFNYKEKINSKMVMIHLKNIPNSKSNANQVEWFKFFKHCLEYHPNYKFVIIGKDKILPKIINLKNVILAKDQKLTMIQELGLINQASLFMGMCSGPFAAALLSGIPYLVFKNPEHHREIMQKEIGDLNNYSFASENQFLIRKEETALLLQEKFSKIIEN